ncbi:HAMP domain-containing sensor histidine kinase [Marinobacter sp. UBA3607]|jgi:two-component system sensor histidine kinase UhpB|uniref:sensor histidine kinase n=1 Tax=Marinobacter sp. UBA3607 TaxID=1946820 RepID=UPI000E821783|nr:HAMP domain-containing protein [Marinobacter sp. UBA3607]HBM50519.1 sensor histidine kinase [Marinobacter sp.]|tara:strand:+ start:106 stop:1329 length:1224 start_codon:yes stop_codon:yes gene_type:complete
MTVYRKISLLMLAVFLLVYLLGALLYTQKARHDVQRELDGVAGLAQSLGSPADLPESVVSSMRHLTPAAEMESGTGGEVPAWFVAMVTRESSRPVVNGWQVDPADEVEEIWEGFLLISGAYAIGMCLCFLALYVMVRRGIRTLASLAEAMGAVSAGQLTSRLPRQGEQELDALVCRFNSMAGALESEQQTVSRLLNELLQLQDREREHIARVLHDDLGQYLTGIRAQARSLLYDPELSDRQKQQARDLAEHCETIQKHFRHLLQDLHPLVMEQLGLGSAIRHLTEQWQQLSGLECRLAMDERLPEFTGEQQTHLYRFLQEALNNVSRHANASCATLAVARKDNELSIEVRDDGVGNDQLPGNAGLGVRSMCERARCLGGEVRFLSRMGEGTRIRLAVPLSPNTGGVL